MGLDLDVFRLAPTQRPKPKPKTKKKRPPRHKRGENFLWGPVPLDWLAGAARLPGRALAVALELWFWAGATRSDTVRISTSHLKILPAMPRTTAARALRALEAEGLVEVVRKPGCKPVVRILEIPAAPDAGSAVGSGKPGPAALLD